MRMFCAMRRILLIGAGLLLCVSPAVGQQIGATPADDDSPQVSNALPNGQGADPLTLPSPKEAFHRSLFMTVVPTVTLVLAIPGLIVGPSTGYFYGGRPGRAWGGIGLRVIAIGGMMSSFAICGWDCGPGDGSYDLAWMVFGGSGALLVGSAIFDIATVKKAVRKNNERLIGRTISFSPAVSFKTRTIGLAVRVGF